MNIKKILATILAGLIIIGSVFVGTAQQTPPYNINEESEPRSLQEDLARYF